MRPLTQSEIGRLPQKLSDLRIANRLRFVMRNNRRILQQQVAQLKFVLNEPYSFVEVLPGEWEDVPIVMPHEEAAA